MWSLLLLLAACDARIAGAPGTGDPPTDAPAQVGTLNDGGGQPDAAPDAPAPLGKWGPPAKVNVASVAGKDEDDSTLSSNGLEMIYAITNQQGQKELFWITRDSAKSNVWNPTVTKLAFNAGDSETPRFSPDDLTLYFASSRNTTDGTLDVFKVQRDTIGSKTWGAPTLVSGVSSAVTDKWYMPCPVKDSKDYLMVRDLGGTKGTHLVESTTGGTATPVPELDGPDGTNETGTFLTNDCLTLYFASTRSGTLQLYSSKRTAIGMAWSKPALDTDYPITGVTGDAQEDPWMSSDLRTFTFVSNAGGDKNVYISTR